MSYKFPPIHNFPPFYTFQEGSREALRIQVSSWTEILLKYMKSKKQNILDLKSAIDSDIFNNKKINRKMSIEDARKIIEQMVQSQNAEYIDENNRDKIKVIWRTAGDWGEIIRNWAVSKSLNGTVFTFYDIAEGDDSADQPFYKLPYSDLLEAAKYLDKHKKGKLMTPADKNAPLDEYGLKIF